MPNIFHRIGFKAPIAKVYDALATIDGIAGWWTKDTTGKSAVGGSIKFRFANPKGEIIGEMDMDVTKLEKNKLVQWRVKAGPPEWIGTDLVFNLSEADGMTILLFGHNNWKEQVEFMGHCSQKWAVFLLSLKDLVETGNGKPSPVDVKIDNWN